MARSRGARVRGLVSREDEAFLFNKVPLLKSVASGQGVISVLFL